MQNLVVNSLIMDGGESIPEVNVENLTAFGFRA
jgi:hypothetical protein